MAPGCLSSVRKVAADTGIISTVFGSPVASLDGPSPVAVDSSGTLYIGDSGRDNLSPDIHKVSNGIITTVSAQNNSITRPTSQNVYLF